jgi:hypothetical protein
MTRPAAAVTTAVTPSSPDRPPAIWPNVPYPDPPAAIDFLVMTFGFEPTALIPGSEPGSYAEIELRWPHGSGGIIIGGWDRPAPNWLHVVTPDPLAATSGSRRPTLRSPGRSRTPATAATPSRSCTRGRSAGASAPTPAADRQATT